MIGREGDREDGIIIHLVCMRDEVIKIALIFVIFINMSAIGIKRKMMRGVTRADERVLKIIAIGMIFCQVIIIMLVVQERDLEREIIQKKKG